MTAPEYFLAETYHTKLADLKARRTIQDYRAIEHALRDVMTGDGAEENDSDLPEHLGLTAEDTVKALDLMEIVEDYRDWYENGEISFRTCHHVGNCPCGGKDVPVKTFFENGTGPDYGDYDDRDDD